MVDVNRLVELDKITLRVKSESAKIRLIVGATLSIFVFHVSLEAGLDAARSETLVAGLKWVLAFLQPERKCVYRF